MSDNIKLIKNCQKGSHKAFDELINTYADTIFGICIRYCKNKEEAEDLLQECLIIIINKINDFKFQGSFEGWIKRLTVNSAINYLKKNNKVIQDNIEERIYDKNLTVNESVISKMSADEILTLINQLPPGCRTVFNLHVIDGYKHTEIAEILNITDVTSRTQFKKARKLLIEMFNKTYKTK